VDIERLREVLVECIDYSILAGWEGDSLRVAYKELVNCLSDEENRRVLESFNLESSEIADLIWDEFSDRIRDIIRRAREEYAECIESEWSEEEASDYIKDSIIYPEAEKIADRVLEKLKLA